jgi:predicted nucleic acid-binding protein
MADLAFLDSNVLLYAVGKLQMPKATLIKPVFLLSQWSRKS